MKKLFLITIILFFGSYVWALSSITTGNVTGSPYCGGESISVPYTVDAPANSGNIYTAQLSDSKGNFSSPVNIGTLAATGSGTISATIPLGTGTGTKYRIRVVSSSPVVIGSVNNKNLKINPKPGGTNATNITACAATLNWNSLSNASSYKVRYKKTNGSYSSAISAGNVTSYTFTGLNAGTSYELNVRAVCSNGEMSDWAKEKNVVTVAVPVPTGATVMPDVITANLNWNDMSCAASYRIRYREFGAPNWFYTTSTTSDKVLTGLFPATDYQAQILTVTATNDSSAYGTLLQWQQNYKLSSEVSVSPFEVFPNPSTGEFKVLWEHAALNNLSEISVENMYGQIIYDAMFSVSKGMNEKNISLSNTSSGLYIVKIKSGNEVLKTTILIK